MNQSENNNAANGTDEIYAAEIFTFDKLPENLAELQARPEASLKSAYKTTALTMAALCSFEKNEDDVYEMLDFLKGPDPLTAMEKQFLKDRLRGKAYKCRSFFEGATTANNYTPKEPFRITVIATPYSFAEENWATLYVKSAGSDSPRPVKLRKKPSTGQWFLNEIQCLTDIRLPEDADPWA